MAFAPTFLVMPSQQILDQTLDIPIEVHFPSSWAVMSTWPLKHVADSRIDANNKVHGFIAPDAHALGDAFLAAGSNLTTETRLDGSDEIVVGFQPRFKGDRKGISDVVTTFVQNYRHRFGHLGPIRVLVDVHERGQEVGGLGRRGGFVLHLASNARDDAKNALLIAHEAFHLWNGHEIIPNPTEEGRTRWFKEGLTQWIAVRTACLASSFSMQDALAEIATTAASYNANPIVSQGEVGSLDRLRFPYDQGFLYAMTIDAILSRAQPQTRIDSWINLVGEETNSRGFDSALLHRSLMTLSHNNADARRFWNEHVNGGQRLDTVATLRGVGLHYIPPTTESAARAIPLDGVVAVYEDLLDTCTETP